MRKIIFVTTNAFKYNSLKKVIESHIPWVTVEQASIELSEPQLEEQEAIALEKARQAWEKIGEPVIVDDSGVYFDRYPGFPGFYTKQLYFKIGFDGIRRLLDPGDRICFRTWVVFRNHEHQKVFLGETAGIFTFPPRPENVDDHAAYSYILAPDGENKTIAELVAEGKPEFLPRHRAATKLAGWLRKLIEQS